MGDVDLSHKFLQIFVDSLEIKRGDDGEVRACHDGWALSPYIRARSMGKEMVERFERGHPGQAGDHRLG